MTYFGYKDGFVYRVIYVVEDVDKFYEQPSFKIEFQEKATVTGWRLLGPHKEVLIEENFRDGPYNINKGDTITVSMNSGL